MKKELSEKVKQKASETYLKLWAYIQEKPNGTVVHYSDVTRDLGLEMDYNNKQKLRLVCEKMGRPHQTIKGVGYVLADNNNAMEIVSHGIKKIGNDVDRLHQTHIHIEADVYITMSPDDKKRFNFTKAVTNAMTLSIENGKKLYKKDTKQLAENNPIIPDVI